MTWKTRTRHGLLLLTIFFLTKEGWTFDWHPSRSLDRDEISSENELTGETTTLEIEIGTNLDADTLQYQLTHWNGSIPEDTAEDITYFGEGLPNVLFQSSANNNSLILADFSQCLYDFPLVTCLKFLLLSQLDNVLDHLKRNNLTRKDFTFLNGAVSFKCARTKRSTKVNSERDKDAIGLDEDITQKLLELFRDRSLKVNLFPGFSVDLAPVPSGDFFGIKARPQFHFSRTDVKKAGIYEQRGMKIPTMMMMPQLIMWGFMPFMLANIKAMIMNAYMMNMMALNSAIFLTIRNLVFGPKKGPKIKYVNYGYKKKKTGGKTLIIHSPAAFVKHPSHGHKKQKHHGELTIPHPPPLEDHHVIQDHPPTHHNIPIKHHPDIQDYPPIDHNHHVIEHHPPVVKYHPPMTQDHPIHHHAPYDSSKDEAIYTDETSAQDEGQHQTTGSGASYAMYSDETGPGYEEKLDHRYYNRHRNNDAIIVRKTKGQLDGMNRVRIYVKQDGKMSVKQLLQRIRAIERRKPLAKSNWKRTKTPGSATKDSYKSFFSQYFSTNRDWSFPVSGKRRTLFVRGPSLNLSQSLRHPGYIGEVVLNRDRNGFRPKSYSRY